VKLTFLSILTQLYILSIIHQLMFPSSPVSGGVVHLDHLTPSEALKVAGEAARVLTGEEATKRELGRVTRCVEVRHGVTLGNAREGLGLGPS
jgi:hypothetical protein